MMKSFSGSSLIYLLISCSLVCLIISFISSGCGDSVITDNGGTPTGCPQAPPLVFPPADTSIQSSPVTFRWYEPSCGPDHYRLIIYSTSAGYYDTTLTPATSVVKTLTGSHSYFWKVTAFYTSPSDSSTSPVYDFYLQP
jgi:hypothetical protein